MMQKEIYTQVMSDGQCGYRRTYVSPETSVRHVLMEEQCCAPETGGDVISTTDTISGNAGNKEINEDSAFDFSNSGWD